MLIWVEHRQSILILFGVLQRYKITDFEKSQSCNYLTNFKQKHPAHHVVWVGLESTAGKKFLNLWPLTPCQLYNQADACENVSLGLHVKQTFSYIIVSRLSLALAWSLNNCCIQLCLKTPNNIHTQREYDLFVYYLILYR